VLRDVRQNVCPVGLQEVDHADRLEKKAFLSPVRDEIFIEPTFAIDSFSARGALSAPRKEESLGAGPVLQIFRSYGARTKSVSSVSK
jgi:hypothetical protein